MISILEITKRHNSVSPEMRLQFLLPMRQSLFYFSGSGKFCLPHGLRHLTRDDKSDVRILNFISDVTYALPRKTPNDVRRRSLCDVKCRKIKEITDDLL